jgi:hypothetical protein
MKVNASIDNNTCQCVVGINLVELLSSCNHNLYFHFVMWEMFLERLKISVDVRMNE